jgi:hypothetical protein
MTVVALVAAVLAGTAATAFAQIPALPDPPAPVINAIDTVESAVYPELIGATFQLEPVAAATGFAFRPACSEAGYAAFILGAAGPSLPIGVIGALSPVFLYCAFTFEPGPADPYLHQIDQATGPQVSSVWNTVTSQVRTALKGQSATEPVVSQLCSVISLAPPTSSFPPPTQRLKLSQAVC